MVSVIIPTYNRAHLLERAVQSVLSQSYRDLEVVIVDDGSVDETDSVLSTLLDRYGTKTIRTFRVSHGGVSKARNEGIKRSQGEWISFLDSDDYWLPRKLERQLTYLAGKPSLQVGHTDEMWLKNGMRINQSKKHRKWEGWFFLPSLQLCLISPSTVLLHRSVLEEVGSFDERFLVVEDYELWLRVTARFPIGYLDEKLVVKTGGHPDQLSATIDGIEKYRLLALEKSITSGTLSPEFLRAARETYRHKAHIYMRGCLKRGKWDEAEIFRQSVLRITPQRTSEIDELDEETMLIQNEVRT